MNSALDAQFLADCGLQGLNADDAASLLAATQNELELRVGTKLSNGLSDEQLTEFECFMDRDEDAVRAWAAHHAPNYRTDSLYLALLESGPESASELDVLSEYCAQKWLELFRPDYPDIVAQELARLKEELTRHRELLLE